MINLTLIHFSKNPYTLFLILAIFLTCQESYSRKLFQWKIERKISSYTCFLIKRIDINNFNIDFDMLIWGNRVTVVTR